jgi:hypothetical protein
VYSFRAGHSSLGQDVVTLLKEWLLSPEHFRNPYPTEAEKKDLVERTGLNMRQLSTWFTNARKRLWRPMVNQNESNSKPPKVVLPCSRSRVDATLNASPPMEPSTQETGQEIEFLGVRIPSNICNQSSSVSGLGFANVQDLQGASALLTLQRAIVQ